jgi:hypothetical protein
VPLQPEAPDLLVTEAARGFFRIRSRLPQGCNRDAWPKALVPPQTAGGAAGTVTSPTAAGAVTAGPPISPYETRIKLA